LQGDAGNSNGDRPIIDVLACEGGVI